MMIHALVDSLPKPEATGEIIHAYHAQAAQALAQKWSGDSKVPFSVDGWIARIALYTACAVKNNDLCASLGGNMGAYYLESQFARHFDFAMLKAGATAAYDHQRAVVASKPDDAGEVQRFVQLSAAIRGAQAAFFSFGNTTPARPPSIH